MSVAGRWKKPVLWSLTVVCTAIRAPEVLADGGWRRWLLIAVLTLMPILLVVDMYNGLLRRDKVDKASATTSRTSRSAAKPPPDSAPPPAR